MPLSTEPDITRQELHVRRIEMRGFQRSDGLFEVESRLIDTKPRDFVPASGGRYVPAGQHIHDLGVRLVYDQDLVVRDVSTFTDGAPYTECPEGGRALQALKGLRMTSGWTKAVRERLGGGRSCTHLMELLTPMATTAFQSLSGLFPDRPEAVDADGRPKKIDSCWAYRTDGALVLNRWPQFYRAKDPSS